MVKLLLNGKEIKSLLFAISLFFLNGAIIGKQPVPIESAQMILVLTDSTTSVKGTLYYFERRNQNSEWEQKIAEFPVVLGRSGLGWGKGLFEIPNGSDFPVKKEGDGRSPAGIFSLSSVFGYKPIDEMKDLKMPYHNLSELTECIDDINSQYYNQIIEKNNADKVDWSSSEKMRSAGIYYELGVVVDHNSDPAVKGDGSCIFLHNWARRDETMAGCTGMAPENMKRVAYLLDKSKNPLLVQLTTQLYSALKKQWNLPEVGVQAENN